MHPSHLIAALRLLSGDLRGARPGKRWRVLLKVAGQLWDLADAMERESGVLASSEDVTAKIGGYVDFHADTHELPSTDTFAALQDYRRLNLLRGYPIGQKPPGLVTLSELNRCCDCGVDIWTFPLDRATRINKAENPIKPICTYCLGRRYPGTKWPWEM